MSTLVKKNDVKTLMQTEKAREQFNQILGKNAGSFMASVVQLSNNPILANCDPVSIISASVIAASLNLSVDPNLGQAAIIPFKDKATLQIMYKGLIQLALRSGQIKTLNAIIVHEGDIVYNNILTGEIKFADFQNFDAPTIGYAAYIQLLNGFEKTIFITKNEIIKHGQRYSKFFNSEKSLWKTDFDKMAVKTVLKMLLSKYSPLSIEMQSALKFDNKVTKINDNFDLDSTEIIDNDLKEQKSELMNEIDSMPTQELFENENNK